MLKILQARLQQYVNHELPDVQLDLEKAEKPEIKVPTFAGSWKKQESSRKTSTSALLTRLEPLTVWITTNCGKFFKIQEYQTTFLLRNRYAGQEATVRTGHGTTDWSKLGKEYIKAVLSPWLFNFYAEYIMRSARLDEAQAGIKVAGRNINKLRYTDDTTLMAEREELKSLLMKVKKGECKSYLKAQHSEN